MTPRTPLHAGLLTIGLLAGPLLTYPLLAQDGSIKGTVKIKLPPDWKPDILKIDKDQAACCRDSKLPKERSPCAGSNQMPDPSLNVDPATGGLAGAVVYLMNAPENGKRDWSFLKKVPDHEVDLLGTTVTSDQKFGQFLPRILLVPKAWSVRLANSDPVAHNTHSYPFNNQAINVLIGPATLGTDGAVTARGEMPPLDGKKYTNESERVPVKITCDVHPWMAGYWVIMDHPYYTITNDKGEFTLDMVPPGTYKVRIWHERFGNKLSGAKGLDVTVKAGEATELTGINEMEPPKPMGK